MMAFEAKFSGKCEPDDICKWNGQIREGDVITKVGEENGGRYAHSACQKESPDAITAYLRERDGKGVPLEQAAGTVVGIDGRGRATHTLPAAEKPSKFEGSSITDMGY